LTLFQEICALNYPISVDIPSGDTVRDRFEVFARINSMMGKKNKKPTAANTAMTASVRLRGRENAPILAYVMPLNTRA
jgi:hypothetical protein